MPSPQGENVGGSRENIQGDGADRHLEAPSSEAGRGGASGTLLRSGVSFNLLWTQDWFTCMEVYWHRPVSGGTYQPSGSFGCPVL